MRTQKAMLHLGLLASCLVSETSSAQDTKPDLVTKVISVKRFARPTSAPAGGWPEFFCELTYSIKNTGSAPATSSKGYLATSFVINGKQKPGQGIPVRGELKPQQEAQDRILIFENAQTSCPESSI